MNRAQRQRQATPAEQSSGEPLSAKRGELFDDAGDGAVGEVQTAVDLGVIVASFALEHPREPERRVRLVVCGAPVPCERCGRASRE